MIINHNLSAINANRMSKINQLSLSKQMEKLASGLRINRAGDDASGLAVSEKMRAQVRGLNRGAMNGEDMISLIQTAEGYLNITHEVIQRIRELAVQAANGIYTTKDRMHIQTEVKELVDEVDRIASHAQFNTLNLLTGGFAEQNFATSLWVHIGANMDHRKRIYIGTMTAAALGFKDLTSKEIFSVSTIEKANAAIALMDVAIDKVSKQRAYLGTYQNRLEFAVRGVMLGSENIQAAESRIRDADIAKESTDFIRDQILAQANMAMISQANLKPQMVLGLLR